MLWSIKHRCLFELRFINRGKVHNSSNNGSDEVKVKTMVYKTNYECFWNFENNTNLFWWRANDRENFNTSPIHNVITKFVIKHDLSSKKKVKSHEWFINKSFFWYRVKRHLYARGFVQSLKCKPKLHNSMHFKHRYIKCRSNFLPFSGYVQVEL